MHTATSIVGRGASSQRRIVLSPVAESRLRAALRCLAPSEPWVDAQFIEVPRMDERGRPSVGWLHDPNVFPPGGSETGMVRCPACGVFTPPITIEDNVCLDHRENLHWGPSPSAVAIRALQYYHLRSVELEIEPESDEALAQEIRQHRETPTNCALSGPVLPDAAQPSP